MIDDSAIRQWDQLIGQIGNRIKRYVENFCNIEPEGMSLKEQSQYIAVANKAFVLVDKIRQSEQRRLSWQIGFEKIDGKATAQIETLNRHPKSRKQLRDPTKVQREVKKLVDEVIEEFDRYPPFIYEMEREAIKAEQARAAAAAAAAGGS